MILNIFICNFLTPTPSKIYRSEKQLNSSYIKTYICLEFLLVWGRYRSTEQVLLAEVRVSKQREITRPETFSTCKLSLSLYQWGHCLANSQVGKERPFQVPWDRTTESTVDSSSHRLRMWFESSPPSVSNHRKRRTTVFGSRSYAFGCWKFWFTAPTRYVMHVKPASVFLSFLV